MVMVEEDLSQCYITLPEKRQGRVLRDIHKGQIIWGACFIAVAIVCMVTGQGITGLFLLFFGIVGAWPFERAAGYKLPGIWLRGGRTKHRGGRIGGTEEEPPVMNLQVDNFLNVIGVVHDNDRNTDTAYIQVRGFKTANADPIDQSAAHELMAEAVKTTISQTVFNISYGFIVGARPFDPTNWASDTTERYVHPERTRAYTGMSSTHVERTMKEWLDDIAKHGQEAVHRAQMANLEQVWHGVAEKGTTFNRIIYLTVQRPAGWKKFLDSPTEFTPQQFSNSSLARVFTALEDGLRTAGFVGVHMMKRDEVRQLVFRSWNVLTNSETFAAGKPLGFQGKRSIWPERDVQVHSDYLQTDECYHAVLMIKRLGKKRILPDGMMKFLIGHPKWVLTSTNVNTTSARRDQYFLRQRRLLHHSLQKDRGGLDEQQDRDVRRADAEAVDQIYESGSKAVRFNVPIVVSTSSTEVLEWRVEAVEAKLRQIGMDARRVNGRSTLLNSFLSASLGVRT